MGQCNQCGKCCSILVFHLSKYTPSNIIQYYEDHGCKVDLLKEKIIIPAVCKYLTKDNLCSIHDNKPDICKNYTGQLKGYYIPDNCGYKED